jgi:exosortase
VYSPWLWFGVFTGCLFAGNIGVVRDLVDYSRSNATASHLIAVPFVTLALIYQNRESIFSSIRFAPVSGIGLVLAGLAFSLWGRFATGSGPLDGSLNLLVAGLVVSWVGGFLLFFGRSAARAALFPLLYLVFTIPIPAPLIDGATQILKKGSTETVAGLFTLTGTPYHRDGFVFSLPSFVIEVADECSGIRSTIALFLTGLLAGHVFLRDSWAKACIVAAVLPVTILKNGIRIVTLSLLAMHVDPGFLDGQLHHEGGIVFFVLGLLIFAPVLALLRKSETRVRLAKAVSLSR